MENGQTGDLVIKNYNDQVYDVGAGGSPVIVRQYCRLTDDEWGELVLEFKMEEPKRFNVRVPVPADCINACATLNGQLLISWFGEKIPAGLPLAVRGGCREHGTPYSTLRPGQPQNINFRWHNGDCLRFYWVWPHKDP